MRINGKDTATYSPSGPETFTFESSSLFEQIEAAKAAGLPLHVYWELPGTRYWAEDNQLTKSVVVAYYRMRKQADAVEHEVTKPKPRSK